ncbi:MAG: radical SAM family heme chaperone HemW [Clostridia bacterium]|nr:radical SAM family heme chaperone HemW [Clostridia bacterium]
MTLQLYMHIPFCKRKCFYCDFCSAPASLAAVEAYCGALEREIALYGRTYGKAAVSTVYIGGGTPSLVPAQLMDRLLGAARRCFCLQRGAEFTVEANPGILSEDWLATVKSHGANRLSLGLQAAQDSLLGVLGRAHTGAQAAEAVDMARKQGFTNINLDVMYGLPGQRLEDYRGTLRQAAALRPSHISAYCLTLEEGTPLAARIGAGELSLPAEEHTAEMAEQGRLWLEDMGYRQYEISNFAKPGFECRHNLGYWRGSWYLGLGVAAASMLPLPPGVWREGECFPPEGPCYLRRENTRNRNMYEKKLRQGIFPTEEEHLIGRTEAMFETMMLGLRTVDGVSERDFYNRFGTSMLQVYGKVMEMLVRDGLGQWKKGGAVHGGGCAFALTPGGMLFQNQVLLKMMG